MGYIIKIDNVLKAIETENDQIAVVENEIDESLPKDDQEYNFDIAYSAEELGYVNNLYTLNGSEWGNGINILIIGSDKKKHDDSKSRADVIVVLRIIDTGKILSISIPRDTLIELRDGKWKGKKDKIGHSYYWHGMENLKQTIEELLGSPIYKVAVIDNFRNFEAFLAVIGGLKIDKNLEGRLGIQWIRNRNFPDGDIERCRRQELFIKRAITKIWSMTKNGGYFESSFAYDALSKIVETDLSKDDFMNIIYALRKNKFYPEKDFFIGVLPGEFSKYDSLLLQRRDLDCWILDQSVLENLQFLFYSKDDTYKAFVDKDVSFWEFLKIDLNLKNKNVKNL